MQELAPSQQQALAKRLYAGGLALQPWSSSCTVRYYEVPQCIRETALIRANDIPPSSQACLRGNNPVN